MAEENKRIELEEKERKKLEKLEKEKGTVKGFFKDIFGTNKQPEKVKVTYKF